MNIVVTPYYSDLFPNGTDTLNALLEDIDSRLILQWVAQIDAELYSKDAGRETQLKLLHLLLERQSPEVCAQIMEYAFKSVRGNPNCHFFSRHYNLNFLHYVLLHFKADDTERQLYPEQDLKLFKAYFLVAEEFGQQPRAEDQPLSSNGDEQFAKIVWPTMADNMEANVKVYHPYHIMVRGIVFLNHFQYRSKYGQYVAAYLEKHNKRTTLNYAYDIFAMLNANFEMIGRDPDAFAGFSFGRASGFETLYQQFEIDPDAYKARYSEKKENYAGIKAHPLFKLNENNWLILNWSFLANKLYEGLVFDFYQNSGIAMEPAFGQFTGFKQFIGEHITEKHLFRSLATKALQRRYDVLLFDDKDQIDGFPDCYYRKGNNVFLFEIKDVYFASDIINSFSYEQIKETIDQKLNNPKRGTGQLIKQLQRISKRAFEKPQRYKSPEHLTIYPILIYTDVHFNMLGVNEYVNRSFDRMLEQADLKKAFRKVKPLTMINLNYLISIFDTLEKPATSLAVQIDYYHHQLANRRKRYQRTKNTSDLHLLYSVFETLSNEIIGRYHLSQQYMAWIATALNLYEGIQPKERGIIR